MLFTANAWALPQVSHQVVHRGARELAKQNIGEDAAG